MVNRNLLAEPFAILPPALGRAALRLSVFLAKAAHRARRQVPRFTVHEITESFDFEGRKSSVTYCETMVSGWVAVSSDPPLVVRGRTLNETTARFRASLANASAKASVSA